MRESEERLVVTLRMSLLASFRNSLVGTTSCKYQTVATNGVRPEIAASSSQSTFLGNT